LRIQSRILNKTNWAIPCCVKPRLHHKIIQKWIDPKPSNIQ
jgi:hypothetical protein